MLYQALKKKKKIENSNNFNNLEIYAMVMYFIVFYS